MLKESADFYKRDTVLYLSAYGGMVFSIILMIIMKYFSYPADIETDCKNQSGHKGLDAQWFSAASINRVVFVSCPSMHILYVFMLWTGQGSYTGRQLWAVRSWILWRRHHWLPGCLPVLPMPSTRQQVSNGTVLVFRTEKKLTVQAYNSQHFKMFFKQIKAWIDRNRIRYFFSYLDPKWSFWIMIHD